ncbi:MAG: 3-phosphoshikimate 1-carboxyvinyltransferase [Candidatus Methanofastidiosia archaeon]
MNIRIKGGIFGGEIEAPPSKSYTHRATVMSFLAKGESTILNPLISLDTSKTFEGVKALGAKINKNKILGGNFKTPENILDCGGSGTTLRLLTGVSCFLDGIVVFTGNKSLRKRPMKDLLETLKSLKARIWSREGFLPIATRGGLEGGKVTLDCKKSSQFLSSLLISLPLAKRDSEVKVKNLKSKPYVEITEEMLKKFGIEVERRNDVYKIPANQSYKPQRYKIMGDFSQAAFFMVAAAIANKKITVKNLNFKTKQGDKKIVDILKRMGADVLVSKKAITVWGGDLKGEKIDCSSIPDLFPILCILGAFAKGKTLLYNAHHLHYKESDRIKNMASELRKLGIKTEERHDGLMVYQGDLKRNIVLNSHDDHRICMALSVAALKSENITIKNVDCVSESYPNFFDDLKRIGVVIE